MAEFFQPEFIALGGIGSPVPERYIDKARNIGVSVAETELFNKGVVIINQRDLVFRVRL